MIRHLGGLSNRLAMFSMLRPGSVKMDTPSLGELDARFFQTMQKIGEIRMDEDAHLEQSVTRASHDSQMASALLLGSGLAAACLLIALLHRNARITKSLREALHTADVNRKKYQRLFQLNPLPIWIVDDASTRLVAVNDMAAKAMGYRASDMLELRLADLRTDETALLGTSLARSRAQDGGTAIWEHRTKSGELRSMNVFQLQTAFDGRSATLCVMEDVTTQLAAQAELRHRAEYDALTGLSNRKHFDERITLELQEARRTGKTLAVIFLDLDNFKEVNDSLGHRVGDALLAHIARRIEHVVGESGTVARYGGDEFMFVSNGATPLLVPLLDSLLAAMTEPVQVSGHELFIEASIGISIYPVDGGDADTLVRNADAAMYLAKQNGRNQYQFYRPELSEAATSRLRVSTRLRQAFRNGALSVLYQPQFDMASGEMIGAEALLRWTDAELGSVSPAVFIPIAEETGLIRGIGAWVLREACHEAARWNLQRTRQIRVSVNVSPLQLEHGDLIGQVRQALRDSGLPPELLELEVTEGALMHSPELAARTLACLREMGVRIAIDDFGTGYSSLGYLKRFRVDRLKIDREFVREIGQDAETEAITLAVIAVAKALNFELIAEGVETSGHRDFLLQNGCTQAQGFLYSRAVSAGTIADIAANGAARAATPPA
ncbi:putative bifunctional diguanylate cyclase/phosphodiesterase [Paraburkholderia lycopersici]|uniref:PAS domain S-box-containing protein/diguanylate cyclase (GGDEF) domain-containing protein n=1 Tax=Paraburkholderia lycopersici TaxID=416944 RepID=A0A1G6YS53_9BURK|nr:GGDEF and EAL domain-containing protein [Paraburkholderia lycopersici]SDD92853.1 PAS domain S-box-containing protein/diguanylate cyclase (GGDEF) domain-containing protein [Paraburkholderia lycopersici]